MSYFKWKVSQSNDQEYSYTNNTVSPAPSAYAYRDNGNFIIKSSTDGYFSRINFLFEIKEFKGVGKYDISTVNLQYYEVFDDLGFDFNSETDSLQMTLSIDSVDEDEISGEFNMTLFPRYESEVPRIIKEGEFIIPIY